MKQMKKRSDSIDYAKGIGILLVILGHMKLLGCAESYVPMTNFIYSFHMPLFFFLTGLTLDRKFLDRQPQSADLKKLAKRLMIPYFAWSAVYILLKCLWQREGLLRLIKRNSAAVLTLRGIAPLWFLAALFTAECLVMLLVYRLGMKKLHLLALTGVLTVTLGNAVQVFRGGLGYYARLPITAFYSLFPCVFFLTLGCLLSPVFTGEKPLTRKQNAGLLLCSAAVLAALNIFFCGASNLYKMSFDNSAAFVAAGTAGSLAVVSLCSLLPENILPMKYLGQNSMLIMVLHYPPFPTVALAESLAVSLGLGSFACAGLVFAMTLAVTVTVCILWGAARGAVKRLVGRQSPKEGYPFALRG